MGVSSTPNRIAYQGDGVTTNPVFSFPYYFFKPADFLVLLYDTIAGGITPLNLNTDFSVSGNVNFQGLYPSGGNVTYLDGVLPTTSYIIIIRNPVQTQIFNLLENQSIPTQPLIQELDYLTLLIQRLEDQLALCVALPDGLSQIGFNPQIPPLPNFNGGAYLQLNPTGQGFVWNQSLNLVGWQSVTIPYSSFSAAALSNAIAAFSLPATAILTGLVAKHSTKFSGTGITDVYLTFGVSGGYDQFVDDFDVFQTVADQAFVNAGLNYIGSWANPTTVYVKATSVGANLSALSQGSVTIFFQTQSV